MAAVEGEWALLITSITMRRELSSLCHRAPLAFWRSLDRADVDALSREALMCVRDLFGFGVLCTGNIGH